MKSIKYIAAVVMAAFTMNVSAQSFIVYGTDGSKTKYYTNNVSHIDFNEDDVMHEYVDLGLPSKTLWATCNLGAKKKTEMGDAYLWGETEAFVFGVDYANSENYKFYKKNTYVDNEGFTVTVEGFTKYTSSTYGYDNYSDSKYELDPEDDAATVNWGDEWTMPTYVQWEELSTKCTWNWATLDNVEGYKVVGPNGNYIFLPTTRYYQNDYYGSGYGYYWSKTCNGSICEYALPLIFDRYGTHYYPTSYRRWYGLSIRPVRK